MFGKNSFINHLVVEVDNSKTSKKEAANLQETKSFTFAHDHKLESREVKRQWEENTKREMVVV